MMSLLLSVVLFAAANSSFSQSYYQSPNDTIIANAVFDDVSVFNITQVHPGADTLYFKWYKLSVNMPSTWDAKICVNGNCFESLRDSGDMIPIVPGDNGLMSLHLDPRFEAGTGIIRYTIFDTNSVSRVDTLTWIITAQASTGLNITNKTQVLVYNTNDLLTLKNLEGQFSQISLFDMNGKCVKQQTIYGNGAEVSLNELAEGMYIVRLNGKQMFTSKIVKKY